MKTRIRANALLMLCAATSVACVQQKAIVGEETLKGSWCVTHIRTDGSTQKMGKGYVISFGDKTFESTVFSHQASVGFYSVDTKRRPKWIDMRLVDDNEADAKLFRGIYTTAERSGKLCIVSSKTYPRPKEFVAAKGDGQTLLILKRLDEKEGKVQKKKPRGVKTKEKETEVQPG